MTIDHAPAAPARDADAPAPQRRPSGRGRKSTTTAGMEAILLETLAAQATPPDLDRVRRALAFAVDAHGDQRRASGEPYVTHPIAVAITLAELGLDTSAIQAALLHDVPEDTDRDLAEVEDRFGPEVAHLVDGVTKLSKFSTHSHEERQAESIRKMFLAMADDIRVVLIKLADRLHNMRTLGALPPEKQTRIARQTLEIYAPLAERLGIWQIKWELEDLAFKALEPDRYRELAANLDTRRARRESYVTEVEEVLTHEL
jgi:GTP diphosphokinase / guanosine-3',5'-bis(diphosphate) 3'-diphosphatase